MKNILFPVNDLRIGGAEQQLLVLVRGLDKRRFHPIVAPLYPGQALDSEFRSIPGVEVADLCRRGKYDPSPLWKLGALLRSRRIDVVQPFLSPATFFGLFPTLFVRAPATVVTERCGVRRSRRLGYKVYRATEDLLTRRADVVVANSNAGRDDLLRRGLPPRRIRVIFNGVNLDRLQPDRQLVEAHRAELQVPSDGHVVGILASLSPFKGHDTLLRAAQIVNERRPGTRYAVVGDGAERERLTTLASDLGIGDAVHFFGSQHRVADFLAGFDLLVSASRDNEGHSNSVLEAMALGVPVVATDIGGNRELVEDGKTGYLVTVDDVAALANSIERALANPAERSQRAAAAKQMIDTVFARERMVSDYEALYDELLSKRRRPSQ